MIDVAFKIINHGTPEYLEAVRLREEILRKPFGLTFLPIELEKEKEHIQIIGLNEDEVVATAVLVPEGSECKMQRVVVKSELQDSGVGSHMMQFCEDQAMLRGFTSIYCHARDAAVSFYLKNGYEAQGDYFEEDTIQHLTMRKRFK